ncbi:MAG: TMEM175 family protein [Pseudomonadota bacterium]
MSHHESAAKGVDARLADRLLFFSDAVFAIVLTLLVFDIKLPPRAEGGAVASDILSALHLVGPRLGTFLVSFLLVGGWWLIHTRVTRRLAQFDGLTAICNFVFLLFITLMPFASSAFSGAVAPAVGLEIYWGVNGLASLSLTLLFIVSSRGGGRLLSAPMQRGEWGFRVAQCVVPGIAFGIGVWGAAHEQYMVAQFCWILIFPLMALTRIFFRPPNEKPAAPPPPQPA